MRISDWSSDVCSSDLITDDHAREVLGEQAWRPDPAKGDASRLVAHRTALMAHLAWKRDLMTEGQLSELLKISRLELRQVIDQTELEDRESDILFGGQGGEFGIGKASWRERGGKYG